VPDGHGGPSELIHRGERLATELLLASTDAVEADGVRPLRSWRWAYTSAIQHGLTSSVEVLARGRSAVLAPVDTVRMLLLEAVLRRTLGDHDGAAELVDRAVRTDPTASRTDPLSRLLTTLHEARYALNQEHSARAATKADAAIHLCRDEGYPGFEPYALSIRAEARAGLGHLNDALLDALLAERLRESTGTTGDRAFGLLVLGKVHRRRREESAARAALTAALECLPGEAEREVLEPVVLAELGRVSLSAEYVARSVEIALDHQRHTVLLARGWVSLAAGDIASAAADAAEARAVCATSAEAWELQALATTDEAAALACLRAAGVGYQQVPDPAGEARIRVVIAALRHGRISTAEHDLLRGHGIRTGRGVADALTVVLDRGPHVVVRALGRFQVFREGEEVMPHEWQSKKARDLLRILVCRRGRPVPRTRLIELLWPGQSSATGSSRLSVQLSILRRVLAVDPLIADRATVALNTEVVRIDVERFLSTAKEALAAHRAGDPGAAELLAAAEELYTGELMPDEPYATWTYELRDEVEPAYVNVLRALAHAGVDVDHRVSCLQRILRRDPYDEDAHLALVGVLHRAGRHGEARKRYRAYADNMREIGVTPTEPVT
jgi:DNA-binding SARP family transcriptional activator